ncbi:ABC transporter permease [Cellulomonas sp. HZM]|uniref:ABC transporter permease n=1 Tax=Cellulomonas sp. HZM TaxID=1454010 RepID=UPI000493199C|nr:ABC transporter permease [Cellulomonas sp. HZM]
MTTTTEPMSLAAIDAAQRPRRFGALYVAEHQIRQMRAYAWTIVVAGVGSPLVYLVGIGLGLATYLDQQVSDGPAGSVSYVWFVAPALLATAAVSVATEEFTYTVMAGFKWRRIFLGMNASPVSPEQICSGVVLAVLARMVFTTLAYYLIILAFGAVGHPWAGFLMPLVGMLAGTAFGLPLLAYSASITEDKGQFAVVQRFVFTPLFLFSGTFYPLATLPVWLQWIGWISPLWHASEVGRTLSYGSSGSGWPTWAHLAVLVAMSAAGWLMARRTFVGRLRG